VNSFLEEYQREELERFLREARDLPGFKRGLQIMLFRYLAHYADTMEGIDNELDGDFFGNFANLLEILDLLSPGPSDTDTTHF
jgi:hypothetical protein